MRSPFHFAIALSLVASVGCTDTSGGDDEVGEVGDAATETDSTESTTQTPSDDETSAATEADSTETSASTETDSTESDSTGVACAYPEGAVEPMALNEVIFPYAWPGAVRADDSVAFLDLAKAPCDEDVIIDWSIHELLVFISVPAW